LCNLIRKAAEIITQVYCYLWTIFFYWICTIYLEYYFHFEYEESSTQTIFWRNWNYSNYFILFKDLEFFFMIKDLKEFMTDHQSVIIAVSFVLDYSISSLNHT
jgi:hypothetical protein